MGFLFLLPFSADGKERIRNVEVEIVNRDIIVSADLRGGFDKKTVEDIQNGITKDFYYYILLKKKEKNWFDEEVDAKTLRYSVKYDTLKKDYLLIISDGARIVERHVTDFEEMKNIVSRVHKIKLAPASLLNPRHRYYVSLKSQMKAAELPFYLDYFLFFIPFLELDTPWADSPLISLEGLTE
ncbi:MAG: DUF4390 domain-containing protein [Nitrospiria bacterium]